MAKYTTESIANEIDYIGRVDGVTVVGRVLATDAQVEDIKRQALATNPRPSRQGITDAIAVASAYFAAKVDSVDDISDVRIDFGNTSDRGALERGTAVYREWLDTTNETVFEDAGGYFIEEGDGWQAVDPDA